MNPIDALHSWVNYLSGYLWGWMPFLLIGVGLFFTVTTFGSQFTLFRSSIREMYNSNTVHPGERHGITPFQAFVTGVASRVGVGNIAGVAIAMKIGGTGAVFWMWVTALIGMSTAVIESSLAQLYKEKDKNGYRGGPAYYITKGLKQKWLAVIFVFSLLLAYAYVFNAVQSNSIVAATSDLWGLKSYDLHLGSMTVSFVGVLLVVLTAIVIFGGVRRIAVFAQTLVPLMAVLYLILALATIALSLLSDPAYVLSAFGSIFTSAWFDLKAAIGGTTGGIVSVMMMNGIKRGLFSNEAGMGSAPNVAASSDVAHPVNQGLIQMLGVFIDTMVVCTCTAVIILLSGALDPQSANVVAQDVTGVQLTQHALGSIWGAWSEHFLAAMIFLFAYSSILGNYAYAENNVLFLTTNRKILNIFRLTVLAMVYFGAVNKIALVWDMADLSSGLMALINLIAILLLSPVAFLLLKDYKEQAKQGLSPVFDIRKYPKLEARLDSNSWD